MLLEDRDHVEQASGPNASLVSGSWVWEQRKRKLRTKKRPQRRRRHNPDRGNAVLPGGERSESQPSLNACSCRSSLPSASDDESVAELSSESAAGAEGRFARDRPGWELLAWTALAAAFLPALALRGGTALALSTFSSKSRAPLR